jgi:hypothetical protein
MSDSLLKNKKLKSKIKNKVRELNFLKGSKKDFDELFSIYEYELNKIISELSQCDSLEFSENQENNEEEKILIDNRSSYNEDGILDSENKMPEDTPGWAKKLYKKIALETHPDKLTNSELSEDDIKNREEIFKKSSELIKQGKFEELVYFASELNIEFEIEDENYLSLVEKSIGNLKEEFNSQKVLVPWIWGNLENSIEKKADFIIFVRDQLGEKQISKDAVESFIFHFENDSLEDWKLQKKEKKTKKRQHPGKSIAQKRKEKLKQEND